jgi:hypothetical protein
MTPAAQVCRAAVEFASRLWLTTRADHAFRPSPALTLPSAQKSGTAPRDQSVTINTIDGTTAGAI